MVYIHVAPKQRHLNMLRRKLESGSAALRTDMAVLSLGHHRDVNSAIQTQCPPCAGVSAPEAGKV